MKRLLRASVIALSVVVTACDAFEYHPYAATIHGKTHVNNTYVEQLENSGLKPPFKFAFVTDTQGSLDEMHTAMKLIRERGDIDFIIHGGDLTDFGLVKEFVWGRDILEEAGLPYVAVIGNHDCLGNGNDTFNYIFGEENFSFDIGSVHFLCLNTVALEYDYSHPVPDLDFIERDGQAALLLNEERPGAVTHTVVVMHSRPYDDQFNNNVAKPFNHYLESFPGLRPDDAKREDGSRARGFCINGHNHSTKVRDIFENGMLYYQCANMGKRAFLVFTITDDGYGYEEVVF